MSSTSKKEYKNIIPYHPAGILFPREILKRFAEYKLDKVHVKEGEDPCKGYRERKVELRNYQKFVRKYLSYDSTFHDLLIYHGLGSGKTCTAINIYNILYSYDVKWNVFILLPSSLIPTWKSEFDKCLDKNLDFKKMEDNVSFISYNAPNANEIFMRVVKEKYQNGNKSIFIIDEAHGFISNVYSNISSGKGRRAIDIYDEIIRHKKQHKYTRTICLSGTPAVNFPFEFALLFNLLRERTFQNNENQFNDTFVLKGGVQSINPETVNLFQRRIMGLVSYFAGATKDVFATSETIDVRLDMPDYHREVYEVFEKREAEAEKNKEIFGFLSSNQNKANSYRATTKQSCNFVFPFIDANHNGETRPKASTFVYAVDDFKDKEVEVEEESKETRKQRYFRALDEFVDKLIQFWNKKMEKDVENGHTVLDDFEKIKQEYDGNVEKYFQDKKVIPSTLFESMYSSSAKMVYICYNIIQSPGPTYVYSNYVRVEGIEVLKIYLRFCGFKSYFEKGREDYKTYGEIHGGVKDKNIRNTVKKIYNQSDNKYGKNIKVILISPSGTEGISLNNVRQCHIMEPHWTEMRIDQVKGRGIRQCSHSDLPMNERHVKIYRYIMVRKKDDKETTDQFVEFVAKRKQKLLDTFFKVIKEVAVDCELFKPQNMDESNAYNCFKFDDKMQMSKELGSVYRKRIEDELGKDGFGSNSMMYKTVDIETVKISGMVRKDNGKYGKIKYYWFYPKKGYVYDFDLNYLIGQVLFDEDGIPEMHDSKTYIIGKTVVTQEISSGSSS
jgi:superfamily II DNA or RNA helicase